MVKSARHHSLLTMEVLLITTKTTNSGDFFSGFWLSLKPVFIVLLEIGSSGDPYMGPNKMRIVILDMQFKIN